ncbi:PIG-L family deacetylase [Pseudodesulfovibrio sp.]|nr:PIG-L family deacetylase [Pseudodesulfovibrio sp.]
MNVLIVAAHPDDEVLGCGGTMARLAAEGHHVSVAILGEGATSRGLESDVAQEAKAKLAAQAAQAAEILGVCPPSMHELPDNRFDSLDLLDVVKIVEELVDTHRPELIFTHHPGDLNIDHQITHRAVVTAARPLESCSVRRILAFEIPSSTEWASPMLSASFVPTTMMDIAGYLETKLLALQQYSGELGSDTHPRSLKHVSELAGVRGRAAGFSAAESFATVWERIFKGQTL